MDLRKEMKVCIDDLGFALVWREDVIHAIKENPSSEARK